MLKPVALYLPASPHVAAVKSLDILARHALVSNAAVW